MKTIITAGDGVNSCEKLLGLINSGEFTVISYCYELPDVPAAGNNSLVLYYIEKKDSSWRESVNEVKNRFPTVPMIVISDNDSAEEAVYVMKMGAVDFIHTALPDSEIKSRIEHSFTSRNLLKQVEEIHELIHYNHLFKGVVGKSDILKNVFSRVEKAMKREVSVLILGESGTGKELFARAIHEGSEKRNGPFITVNSAAITPDLAESLLFGHVKGSFTGSVSPHKGYFSQANGGSIFLDEIGDMHREVQGMVLRVIEERKVRPLGSLKEEELDVRIIAATNRDLGKMIEQGTFREDLFYRIDEFPVTLPPLRERKEDIPLLAEHFLKEFCLFYEIEMMKFSTSAIEQLQSYDWPGNVRELKNIVRREAVESIYPVIDSISLPDKKKFEIKAEDLNFEKNIKIDDNEEVIPLALLEEKEIKRVFMLTGGNAEKTALLLGLSRATLYRKLKLFGML